MLHLPINHIKFYHKNIKFMCYTYSMEQYTAYFLQTQSSDKLYNFGCITFLLKCNINERMKFCINFKCTMHNIIASTTNVVEFQ